jgi:hypothetical protein
MFEGYVLGRGKQQMDVLRHEDEGVELVTAFAPVSEKSRQKDPHIVLDDKKPSPLPGRERNEICSWRRNESYRLQSKPQRLEAACFAKFRSARVELVPFPVTFVVSGFNLGSSNNEKPSV